jgi:hypothetical protein
MTAAEPSQNDSHHIPAHSLGYTGAASALLCNHFSPGAMLEIRGSWTSRRARDGELGPAIVTAAKGCRRGDHELSQITSSRDAGVVPVDDRNRVH